MHRKSKEELLPLDTEIVRTLKNLRKATSAEDKSMETQRERMQTFPKEDETEITQRPNTVKELWRLVIQEEYSAMRQPPIEANNFKLKP